MVTINYGAHILCLAMIIGGAVAKNSIKAVCNPDNTVDVTLDYDKNATILDLTYGSCTESSPRGVSGHTGWSDSGWNVSLDVEACEMDDKVRTIEYWQNATFTIGVNDTIKLVFAVFTVESFCEYTKSYKVKFSYGALEAEEESFGASGGTLDVAFIMKSMNSSFSGEETAPTVAGNHIYLELKVNSTEFPHYDHADNFTATSGKLFAPKSCSVFAGDSSVNMTYTLFGPDKCDNEHISLEISYDNTTSSWHISHILFLLGDLVSSSYELECTVIVCDASSPEECVKVHGCLVGTPDKGETEEKKCVPNAAWRYKGRDCATQAAWIIKAYSDSYSWGAYAFTDNMSSCGEYFFDSPTWFDASNGGQWRLACCPQNFAETQACIDASADWLTKPFKI